MNKIALFEFKINYCIILYKRKVYENIKTEKVKKFHVTLIYKFYFHSFSLHTLKKAQIKIFYKKKYLIFHI